MPALKIEKHWTEGGQLFVKVSCPDRETLTNGVRGFVAEFVNKPENNLSGWMGAGVEKAECPQAFDPAYPDMDIQEANEKAVREKRAVAWVYTQIVKLTKGI